MHCVPNPVMFESLFVFFLPGKITLHDLKKCKMANVFFDTFFNIDKYLDHEQKDQFSIMRVSANEVVVKTIFLSHNKTYSTEQC